MDKKTRSNEMILCLKLEVQIVFGGLEVGVTLDVALSKDNEIRCCSVKGANLQRSHNMISF